MDGTSWPERPRTAPSGATAGVAGTLRCAFTVRGVAADYALDWAVVVISAIVMTAADRIAPREVYMRKDALALTSYPLLGDTVPPWTVPLLALALPAATLAAYVALLPQHLLPLPLRAAGPTTAGARRAELLQQLLLMLLTAVLFTAAITNCVKPAVARLRPDFNARCWPDGAVAWQRDSQLGGWPRCAGDAGAVMEGRKSFPSGHSAWSSSGLGTLTWLTLDVLGVWDGNGHPWRLVVGLCPALGAMVVGLTRIMDYWHHWTDVLAGLVLGFGVSYLVYWQHRSRAPEEALRAVATSMGAAAGSGGGGASGASRAGEVVGLLRGPSARSALPI